MIIITLFNLYQPGGILYNKRNLLKFGTISLTKLNSKLITFVEIDFFYAN